MILGSDALRSAMQLGQLTITPFEGIVEPASIDLRLADDYLLPLPNRKHQFKSTEGGESLDVWITDAAQPVEYEEARGSHLVIPAHGFCLARTMERVTLDNTLTGFVEGRSSVGRLGLFIQNAGWVDPGFDGTITLELFNALPNPVLIPAGIRICQLVVAYASLSEGYKGKYQGQMRTMGTSLWKDAP